MAIINLAHRPSCSLILTLLVVVVPSSIVLLAACVRKLNLPWKLLPPPLWLVLMVMPVDELAEEVQVDLYLGSRKEVREKWKGRRLTQMSGI